MGESGTTRIQWGSAEAQWGIKERQTASQKKNQVWRLRKNNIEIPVQTKKRAIKEWKKRTHD